jgi:prepilin-type N-terminal cleavage/methylation domain-containing protein
MRERHHLSAMRDCGGERGFTLTELLMAMGLFSVLGVGLVSLLSRSADFLTAGQAGAETLDALQTFTESFAADVETIYTVPDADTGRPDVRMYADHVDTDIDGDSKSDARIQRLFFTRLIPREATTPLTRAAGTTTDGKALLDQTDDFTDSDEGKLRATGGLMEVFWTALPDDPDDPALMTLYRGFVSPIGGETSMFPRGAASDPSVAELEKGPTTGQRIRAAARPVQKGVLHFGVQFWSRTTNTWDEKTPPRSGGPLDTWDSTRGILPRLVGGDRFDGFVYAKDFDSIEDPTDDTYPRRMRVTLVVEQLGNPAAAGFLVGDLSTDASFIDVADARFVPASDTQERFVKIGAEWIKFTGVEGNSLLGCTRGVRGTRAQAHSAGARVHHGRTVVREYSIATFRDTYSDQLKSVTGRGN